MENKQDLCFKRKEKENTSSLKSQINMLGKKHDRKVEGFLLRLIGTTRQNCRKYQTNTKKKMMCVCENPASKNGWKIANM